MPYRVSTIVLLLVGAGCGGKTDEWNRAAVRGRIMLGGQPLQSGTITFFPIGGTKGPAAGGEIVDGEYSIEAAQGPVVGLNRIEIRSVQKTGRMVRSPAAVEADGPYVEGRMVEEFADVVPKRYNTYSELEREVQGEIVNEFNWELDAKPDSPRAKRDRDD